MTDFTKAQREEIKEIVHEALTEYFASYGATGKQIIITTAMIFGSIAVILGSARTVIGWFGFHQ